jgi:hypothetical protein
MRCLLLFYIRLLMCLLLLPILPSVLLAVVDLPSISLLFLWLRSGSFLPGMFLQGGLLPLT